MNKSYFTLSQSEPYRIFFPLGVIFLLAGSLVWLPQIWDPSSYPVLLHRFLMLNGFVACFIAGFLMTAVPKFSKTETAKSGEILSFLLLTFIGCGLAHLDSDAGVFTISAFQAIIILFFLLSRIFKRQENPPYTFVFIFVGLLLWIVSSLGSIFLDLEGFKHLHYEGSIAAIILGVGSRLIPGILGHVAIVSQQRKSYEVNRPLLATVPVHFYFTMVSFVGSYFLSDISGAVIRALVVSSIGLFYWQLFKKPQERSALTWCIWTSAWLVVGSFILKVIWQEGVIHSSHAFFLSGIVLLSILIATRVLVSHGPADKTLENSKVLFVVTLMVVVSTTTRVSAYLMEEAYQSHLGYSSLLLTLAVLVWSLKYLKFIKVSRP